MLRVFLAHVLDPEVVDDKREGDGSPFVLPIAMGDLALAGAQFIGQYRSYRGGHKMNALALKTLLSDPTAYEVVETQVPKQRVGARDMIRVHVPEFAPWTA